MVKKYSISELKSEFKRLDYSWDSFMIVGIRSNDNLPNQFDDLIGVVNKTKITWFTGTTNPGTHWLKNLLNPKGAAVLKPNQYVNSWKLGLHQGKYTALTQCRPVTVFRDKNLNDIAEETAVVDTGLFGINIHRANDKLISKIIDKWSAGCQVLNNPVEFNELLSLCKASGKNEFTYTLLKEF
jgi:hypothetical protein